MTNHEAIDLFAYTEWANARVLDAASALSDADYTRDLHNSFPSVRDTLEHIMAGEWVWLSRWQGSSPTAFPEAWRALAPNELAQQWSEIQRARRAYLEAADPQQPVKYRRFAGAPYTQRLH